jgi:hypothetical protein
MKSPCQILYGILGAGVVLISAAIMKTPTVRTALAGVNDEPPAIRCPAVIDLGPQERRAVAVARFDVANVGGKELVLDDFRSSCSCAGIEREVGGGFDRVQQLRIPPGGREPLLLRMGVWGPAGEAVVTSAGFRTNDPKQPDVQIAVRVSNIMAGVAPATPKLMIGNVPVGAEVRRTVDIRDWSKQPRSLGKVVSSLPDLVRASLVSDVGPAVDDSAEAIGAVVGRVEIAVETTRPGPVDETVQIYLADGSQASDSIRVIGRIVAEVEAIPSVIVLPRFTSTGPVNRGTCLCRSSDGRPLDDVTVESAPTGVTARVVPVTAPSATRRVEIECNPDMARSAAAKLEGRVRLKAVVGGRQTTIEIPVLCRHGGS